MNWIPHPVILEGEKVTLLPLDNVHFPALLDIAKQKDIWEFMSVDYSDTNRLLTELKSVTLQRITGEQYPFTIFDKVNDKIIGSTRFHNIFPQHLKLEIGWTWYDPAYWNTGYNTECKLLLLTYCFEVLQTVRVQLVTSDKNLRSQRAIKSIGAQFEGVQRKERKIQDGSYRNTAVYSIIDDEWPAVKETLQQKLIKRLDNNLKKQKQEPPV